MKTTPLLLALIALLFAAPAFADETTSDEEPTTSDDRIKIADLNLEGMLSISLMADSAESDALQRTADLDSGSIAMGLKGRAGYDIMNLTGIFMDFGFGLNLGAMDAFIEDARPAVSDDDLFGGLYGANAEFGVGAFVGPISGSIGLTARTIGGVLADDTIHYTDRDNDGFFEEENFTVSYGYWATYLEASFKTGAWGTLGGSGITIRYMPTVGFNFREGEDKTWGYSVRLQGHLDFGPDLGTGVFFEFGEIADESEGSDDVWWLQVGVLAFF